MKTTNQPVAQHTPGPWSNESGRILADARYVATVDDWSNPNCAPQYRDINDALRIEAESNARLIAAAPDLLAALYSALPFVEDAEKDQAFKPGYVAGRINEIRAAIARAEGGAS